MTDFHDRFLIIDNVELHGLGSSINCLGRRVTSYTTRDALSPLPPGRGGEAGFLADEVGERGQRAVAAGRAAQTIRGSVGAGRAWCELQLQDIALCKNV